MTHYVESHRRKIYLTLFFAVVAFLYTLPIFHPINNWGPQDWDQHFFYHGVPRETLLEYRQVPLWNPYYVGGTILLANPQSRFLSPSFPLILLFGEVIGLKIEMWLYLVIGLLGTYALARHYRLSISAALLASFVFMLGSMYALMLTVGITWFLSVAYLPWAFLFYLKALSDLRYTLASGFFLALMFFGGGVYLLPITLLFFAVYSFILFSFREYSFFRLVKLMLVIVTFTLCLGAVKILPAIEFQLAHPRLWYGYSGYSLNSLRFSLFRRDQTMEAIINLPIEQHGFLNGVTGGMGENGMYIGLFPFLLFILGIGLHSKRRMFLFLCLLIFLWIIFGNRPRAELWSLLHLLPIYNSMRMAQRFRVVFVLCLAILAGFGFQTVKHYLFRVAPNRTLAQFLTSAILLAVLTDFLAVSWPILKNTFSIPPLEITRSDDFYQIQKLPPYFQNGWIPLDETGQLDPAYADDPLRFHSSFGSSLYPAFLSNLGTVDGYEPANVPRNAVPASANNYKGEVYLEGTAGTVAISGWSPNRLIVDVDVSSPGVLVVNQNYYPGWHAANGEEREVEEVDQLLAVKVFPGDQKVELYYRPMSFVVGAFITMATTLFSLIFAVRQFALGRFARVSAGLVQAQLPAA